MSESWSSVLALAWVRSSTFSTRDRSIVARSVSDGVVTESMASTAALVGGRMLPGFFWLLFPISVDPSVAVLEGCRSPYFEGGGSDVEDIALIFGGFADFVR
ncbi:hypothetical protein Bca4012_073368 [Brassica carinata]